MAHHVGMERKETKNIARAPSSILWGDYDTAPQAVPERENQNRRVPFLLSKESSITGVLVSAEAGCYGCSVAAKDLTTPNSLVPVHTTQPGAAVFLLVFYSNRVRCPPKERCQSTACKCAAFPVNVQVTWVMVAKFHWLPKTNLLHTIQPGTSCLGERVPFHHRDNDQKLLHLCHWHTVWIWANTWDKGICWEWSQACAIHLACVLQVALRQEAGSSGG